MSAKTLVIAKWNNGNRKSKLKMERTRKTSNLCSLKLCSLKSKNLSSMVRREQKVFRARKLSDLENSMRRSKWS
jgi:hypothetical protein